MMNRLCLAAVLAVCLGGCRPVSPPLAGGKPVSHWVAALKGPDARLRRTAVLKLGNVGATDPAVWPALREALNDPDATVRREAIIALMKFGPGAQEAIPALTALRQRDPDRQVRASAAQALEKLKPTGKP
jgi:HEAT repeat protein